MPNIDLDEAKATHRWTGNFILDYKGISLEPGAFFSPTNEDLEDPTMKEFVDSGFVLDLKNLKDDEK